MIETRSPTLQADSLISEPRGKPLILWYNYPKYNKTKQIASPKYIHSLLKWRILFNLSYFFFYTPYLWYLNRNLTTIQFSSVAQSCLTLYNAMNCNTPGFPVYHQLPELTQTHLHQVSDAIQPSLPLSSPSPPSFNLSQNQGLSSESGLHIRWPKYWSFNFSISTSNEYSRLISFKIDWLDFAVQGIHKNLLQSHSSKASIHLH